MEDSVLDFGKAYLNFQNSANLAAKSNLSDKFNLNYFVGQCVCYTVTIPLSAYGREKLKIPHPAHSPATANLLKCLLRHLSSSLDVKTAIIPVVQKDPYEGLDVRSSNSAWYSGLLVASQPNGETTPVFVSIWQWTVYSS